MSERIVYEWCVEVFDVESGDIVDPLFSDGADEAVRVLRLERASMPAGHDVRVALVRSVIDVDIDDLVDREYFYAEDGVLPRETVNRVRAQAQLRRALTQAPPLPRGCEFGPLKCLDCEGTDGFSECETCQR